VPGSQLAQVLLPVPLAKLPGAQGAHADCPLVDA